MDGVHPLLVQFTMLAVGGSLFAALWLAGAGLLQPEFFSMVAAPVLRRLRRKGR